MTPEQIKSLHMQSQAWASADICLEDIEELYTNLKAAADGGMGVAVDRDTTGLLSACVGLVLGDLMGRKRDLEEANQPLVRLGPGGDFTRDITGDE